MPATYSWTRDLPRTACDCSFILHADSATVWALLLRAHLATTGLPWRWYSSACHRPAYRATFLLVPTDLYHTHSFRLSPRIRCIRLFIARTSSLHASTLMGGLVQASYSPTTILFTLGLYLPVPYRPVPAVRAAHRHYPPYLSWIR